MRVWLKIFELKITFFVTFLIQNFLGERSLIVISAYPPSHPVHAIMEVSRKLKIIFYKKGQKVGWLKQQNFRI